jgi:hypothetical protein
VVVEACRNLRFLYQCCLPQRARMASEKYLKDAANKIKAKVIFSFFCLMSVILFLHCFSCFEFLRS